MLEKNQRLLHDLRVHQIELETQNEELRRAQLELETARASYFDLYDQAPVGYCSLSAKGLMVEANLTAARLLGVTRAALTGQALSRYLNPSEADRYFMLYKSLLQGAPEACGDFEMLKTDGTKFWVHLSATTCTVADEIQVRLAMTDISQQKQAEADLRASDRRFRDLVDSTDGIVWEADLSRERFYFVSSNAERVLGHPAGDWLQTGFWASHIEAEDRDRALELCSRCQDHHLEYRFWTKSGRQVWLRDQVKVVEEDGKPRWLRGLMLDVTALREAAQERSRLEAQLQQAQKLESIGRLAGGVAHDFNNMLGIILGHSELALTHLTADSPAFADVTEIYHSAQRSADLTRQLLAFARKQPVLPERLDLNQRVEGTLKMLQRLLGEDIQLSWQPCPNAGHVVMDPSQLDQILTNLCLNARDAIAGIGNITIETEACVLEDKQCADLDGARPGEYVRLCVRDDGCGIEPEALSHIFEPFYTTKPIGRGTGLGLATVHGSVKQNAGFLQVTSQPNQGTEINIYLPRAVGALSRTAPQACAPLPGGSQHTILVVEDEPALLKLATRVLKSQGYEVLPASSPSQALELASQWVGSLDLLLTDVIMPEMNGLELVKQLLARHPGLKHMFMSGYTADVLAERGVEGDRVNFLPKPFTSYELASKVRGALERA